MFLPVQIALFVGAAFLVFWQALRGRKWRAKWKTIGMFLVAFLLMVWWPLVFLDEESRTVTDSEGTYLRPAKPFWERF